MSKNIEYIIKNIDIAESIEKKIKSYEEPSLLRFMYHILTIFSLPALSILVSVKFYNYISMSGFLNGIFIAFLVFLCATTAILPKMSKKASPNRAGMNCANYFCFLSY